MVWQYQGDRINTDDMNSKFRDTYIELRGVGICQVSNFDADSVAVVTPEGKQVLVSQDDFLIDREYPAVDTMVNYRNECFLISRVPQRQWKVGLIRNTLRLVRGADEIPVSSFTTELLNCLFNPEYPKMDEAYQYITKHPARSIALNANYWMCGEGKDIVLNRKTIPVGTIIQQKDGTFKVNVFEYSCTLAQELKDEFNNGKYAISVSLPQ